MHHFQKNIFFKAFLMSAFVGGLVFLTPTDILAKKLEIIIGGENYCKTDEECSGTSYCHNTSHICISCPKPFEWTGTDCVCPTGTVPNADNTSCVECITDENCTSLKGGNDWYCDTSSNTCLNCAAPKEWHADTNTCDCPSNSSDEGGVCVCDHPNKVLKDGVCQCRVTDGATACPNSDFMGKINCYCCPDDKPVWNKSSGELARCLSCSEIDNTKPHYDSNKKQCVECLMDDDCAKEKECSVKNTCTCAITQDDCYDSDFMGTDICVCCPSETPVYDSISGMCNTCADINTSKPYYNSDTHTCEVCPEPTPSWNADLKQCECPISFGAIHGLGDGTQACWPYCEKQDVGLLLFIDRSGSTKGTYESYISSALASITVPDIYKVAAFLDHGGGQNTKVTTILPYDFYTNEQIQAVVQNYTLRTVPDGTSFTGPLTYVRDHICTGEERFLMVMWTDANATFARPTNLVQEIKNKCPNSKLYYVSPSNNVTNANRWFNIKTLASDEAEAAAYATFLQDEIKQEGCVPRPEETTK